MLKNSPLMCEPSWSWSVISITFPYRSFRRSSSPSASFLPFFCVATLRRALPCSSPRIALMAVNSAFWSTLWCDASRTFFSFPFNGNTPYRSRPNTDSPDTARDLAESPSVRISVHSPARFVPAQFASSSFGISGRLLAPVPAVEIFLEARSRSLSICTSCIATTSSSRPVLSTIRLSCTLLSTSSDPNCDSGVTRSSFAWESKAGLTMKALTTTHKQLRTSFSLTSSCLCFFLKSSIT
mmetsp:Transcript_2027/g.4717  ORF Transcript_2027/g.4717 Transcript_2027/m.4717 type:complete len:239 (-) Transcript_2027:1276-1992(-)